MAIGLSVPAFDMPLSAAHVRMLNDGTFFLAHLDSLATDARIVPACTTCQTVPTVRALVGADAVEVGCPCRAGRVKTHQRLDLQPLLMALGWMLMCQDCSGAVVGDNDPKALVWSVRCPCMTRTYRQRVH